MSDPQAGATMAKEVNVDDEETKVADGARVVETGAATTANARREAPTLRDVFVIPENASDHGDDHWQAFQSKLTSEAKGIKWTAAMPDLGAKICELLDIKVHDILLAAWKKVESVRKVLADSKLDPEKSIYLDLAEHSIDYETNPFIDVKLKAASIKKITLTVALNFKLKGFTLKVQNGVICEMQTGSCEAKGNLKYDKLTIAEKKLSPIKLPLVIKIPSWLQLSNDVADDAAEPKSAMPESAVTSNPEPAPAEPLERIEL